MQFDENFLEEMNLGSMPDEQKRRFLIYLQEELEVKIGERISEGVPEWKLEQFDAVENQEEAAKWLEENRPDFREVVSEAIEAMKAEIRENHDRLLATS